MRSIKLILTTIALATATTTTMADINKSSDDRLIPTGVRAEVGTTGYGGAIQWTANPYVGLSLGYNGGDISWRDDLKVNGSKYDYDVKKNGMVYLNTELRPWGTSNNMWAEVFYVALGVAYIDYKADLKRHVGANQDFSVNHAKFTTGDDGVNVKGEFKYRKVFAPYVGLGYAPKLGNHWGVFAEGGAYYVRSPLVRLSTSGQVTNGRQTEFQQAVRNEAREISDKNKYEWMPVAKVGVNFFW